ncbi:hypothetical protein PRZ48_008908 [Zasmidium cellare]|uniref:RING-type domain-containing protein n=1 Tax=Zasmidium cellare TaxID=395010 RepID=A0ABR0EHP7_ZASCE|nr:hypothetical protein PRZ48_008908 [Zasmidium cellare]
MTTNATADRVEREFRRLDLTFKAKHQAELEEIRESDPGPHDQEEMAGLLVGLFSDIANKYKKHCYEIRTDWRKHSPLTQGELDQLCRRHNKEIDELESWAVYLAFDDAVLTGDSKDKLVDSNAKYQYAKMMMAVAHEIADDLSLPFRVQQARQTNPEHASLVDAYRVKNLEAARECLKIVNEVADAGMAAQTEEQVERLWNDWLEKVQREKDEKATLQSIVGAELVYDLFNCHADFDLIHNIERGAVRTIRHLRKLWFYGEVDDEDTTDEEIESDSDQEENDENDGFESDWESDDGVNVQWTAQDFQNLRNHLPAPTQITVDLTDLSNTKNRTVFENQILDNKCANCLYEYTEATELTGCHHVFCFQCIAPTVQGYKKCPECRAAVEIGQLRIYEITRVGMAEDEQGAHADGETVEDVVDQSDQEDGGASGDESMPDAESEDDGGDPGEEDMLTNMEVEMEDAN